MYVQPFNHSYAEWCCVLISIGTSVLLFTLRQFSQSYVRFLWDENGFLFLFSTTFQAITIRHWMRQSLEGCVCASLAWAIFLKCIKFHRDYNPESVQHKDVMALLVQNSHKNQSTFILNGKCMRKYKIEHVILMLDFS